MGWGSHVRYQSMGRSTIFGCRVNEGDAAIGSGGQSGRKEAFVMYSVATHTLVAQCEPVKERVNASLMQAHDAAAISSQKLEMS